MEVKNLVVNGKIIDTLNPVTNSSFRTLPQPEEDSRYLGKHFPHTELTCKGVKFRKLAPLRKVR